MVQHERVAEDVYSFRSNLYAAVNAGAVVGPDWAVIIDTLALPEETMAVRDFIEQELQIPVRYVINTHYHADHSWGNHFFPGAVVIAHGLCRKYLAERGVQSLEAERSKDLSLQKVKIVLPHITFLEGSIELRVGKKTLKLFHLPGHSPDGTGVLIKEDRVLFSGDIFLPLPYIVDGDYDECIKSMKKITTMGLENVVEGHGDIILRGEVGYFVDENIAYLSEVKKAVRKAARRKYPLDLLETIDVESCGKSRVLMGGLAEELHKNNLIGLYRQLYGEDPIGSEDEYEIYGDR